MFDVEFALDETANNRRVLDKNDAVDPMIFAARRHAAQRISMGLRNFRLSA